VLRQIPTAQDIAGIALVVAGVAVHQDRARPPAGDDPGARQPAGVDPGVRQRTRL
jgi:hypothetical protein